MIALRARSGVVLRWLAAVTLLSLALPGSAGAQSAPSISLDPFYGRAGAGGTWTIQVSSGGDGWYACSSAYGTIYFDGTPVGSFASTRSGWGPVTITVARRGPGPWTVSVVQRDCPPPTRGPFPPNTASATFWSIDATATDVGTGRTDCAPSGTAFSLRVDGRGFEPGDYAYVSFIRDGEVIVTQSRIPVQKDGTFSRTLAIPPQPPDRDYSIYIYDLGKRELTLPWVIPCPTRPTTTTTSTTIKPDGTTTTSTTAPSTETARELFVEPPLGPPGFVTSVRGTGFPPGPAVVRWEGGIGQVSVTVAPDGTFATPLLVLPNDRLGERKVVAEAGPAVESRPFLVVPGTVKPSGRDVTQITRIRRHLQR